MTDTDKELARQWAVNHSGRVYRDMGRTSSAARYILATLADDRDGSIRHLNAAVERLTKERDEALAEAKKLRAWNNDLAQKTQAWPAAEDAELDAAVNSFRTGRNIEWSGRGQSDWATRVQRLMLLLAARVKDQQLADCLLALARLRNAWRVYEDSTDTSTDWQEVRAAQNAVKMAVGNALNSDAIRFARDVG